MPGGVLVKKTSVVGLAGIDTLLFDLDGVIIDPTDSIQAAHPEAIKLWAERIRGLVDCDNLVCDDDIGQFKLTSGFNDDWNIASAVGLFYSVRAEWLGSIDGKTLLKRPPALLEMAKGADEYGGGVDGAYKWLEGIAPNEAFTNGIEKWSRDLVMQIFMEVVAGPNCREMYGFDAEYYEGPGYVTRDKLLVDPAILDLPYKVGVYTGRTLGEMKVAFRVTGLNNWPPSGLAITVDDRMPKPAGEPLNILTRKLGSTSAAFIGDNGDDLKSVMLYRDTGKVPVYSIQLFFGPTPNKSREAFIEQGADMVAPDSTVAIQALQSLREKTR